MIDAPRASRLRLDLRGFPSPAASQFHASYDQIDGKLALHFRNLGPPKLKNSTKPIEVFAIDQSSESDEAVEHERTKAVQTIGDRSADCAKNKTGLGRRLPQLGKAGEICWIASHQRLAGALPSCLSASMRQSTGKNGTRRLTKSRKFLRSTRIMGKRRGFLRI